MEESVFTDPMSDTDNKNNIRYGLLGQKLPYSFSPRIHALLGNEDYRLIELEPEELPAFMKEGSFLGINVTIPYKKAVMPYLDEISDRAKRIGSVNTIVRREDGSLYGDNTDYAGLKYLTEHAGIELKGEKVLILGSGGTSLTARTLCEDEGAGSIDIVSRSGELNYENVYDRHDTAVIINTTPVGTYPGNGKAPIELSRFPGLSGVVDVIYNPRRTKLINDAEGLGIKAASGLRMLIAQAKYAHEEFFAKELPDSVIEDIYRELKNDLCNICIIGMPGCGKSTIGKSLAELTGKEFADTDEYIEREAGMSIPEIFDRYGETYFRELETEACNELGKRTGMIIATGGGVVLRKRNMRALRQNGGCVFLERDIDELSTEGRPLSRSREDVIRIYEDRIDRYRGYSEFSVKNEFAPLEIAERIRDKVYEAADY